MYRIAFILITSILCCACQELHPKKPASVMTVWRQVQTWSGHGHYQTEPFDMEVLQWRIIWRTTHEARPGTGTIKIGVQSAVSGRPISVAVEHTGAGGGVAYVNDDPRVYYLVIDSENLDWTVTVEQPFQETR